MKDDVISRQAALALAKDIVVPSEDGTWYRHRCIDPQQIMELSPAQPEHNPDDERKIADLHKMVNYLLSQLEQRWIPVREKPIEKGLMLVTYNDGDVDLLKQPTAYRYSDIVAWMPCPEPWKEGETDEVD